jgi:hypothetical protein
MYVSMNKYEDASTYPFGERGYAGEMYANGFDPRHLSFGGDCKLSLYECGIK